MMFGPRGDSLVTAGPDTIRVWDLSALVSHAGAVSAVAVGHQGHLLATAGEDHTARLWRIDDNGARHVATLRLSGTPVHISFSPDDRTLVLSGYGSTQVWDISEPAHPVPAADLPPVYSNATIAADPADTTLLIGQRDGNTKLYDLADPYQPKLADDLGSSALYALAIRPGGDMLAVEHVALHGDLGPGRSRHVAQARHNVHVVTLSRPRSIRMGARWRCFCGHPGHSVVGHHESAPTGQTVHNALFQRCRHRLCGSSGGRSCIPRTGTCWPSSTAIG